MKPERKRIAERVGATGETPSPPSDGGEGRGEEGRCVRLLLYSVMSPLWRRGERKKERAPKNLRKKPTDSWIAIRPRPARRGDGQETFISAGNRFLAPLG